MGFLIGIQTMSSTPSFASQWANGFGNALPSEMAGDDVSGAAWNAVLLGNVVAANIPQIGMLFLRQHREGDINSSSSVACLCVLQWMLHLHASIV